MPTLADFQNTDLANIWSELSNRSILKYFTNVNSVTMVNEYNTWLQANSVLVTSAITYKDGVNHYIVITYCIQQN